MRKLDKKNKKEENIYDEDGIYKEEEIKKQISRLNSLTKTDYIVFVIFFILCFIDKSPIKVMAMMGIIFAIVVFLHFIFKFLSRVFIIRMFCYFLISVAAFIASHIYNLVIIK